MSSQNRFGYEWDRYAVMTQEYEGQFRNWTTPFSPKIGGERGSSLEGVSDFFSFSCAGVINAEENRPALGYSAVDMAIVDKDQRVLLITKKVYDGKWSFPGEPTRG